MEIAFGIFLLILMTVAGIAMGLKDYNDHWDATKKSEEFKDEI